MTRLAYVLAAVPVLVVLWLAWRSDEQGTAGDWFCAHRAEQVAPGEWRYPEGCVTSPSP